METTKNKINALRSSAQYLYNCRFVTDIDYASATDIARDGGLGDVTFKLASVEKMGVGSLALAVGNVNDEPYYRVVCITERDFDENELHIRKQRENACLIVGKLDYTEFSPEALVDNKDQLAKHLVGVQYVPEFHKTTVGSDVATGDTVYKLICYDEAVAAGDLVLVLANISNDPYYRVAKVTEVIWDDGEFQERMGRDGASLAISRVPLVGSFGGYRLTDSSDDFGTAIDACSATLPVEECQQEEASNDDGCKLIKVEDMEDLDTVIGNILDIPVDDNVTIVMYNPVFNVKA